METSLASVSTHNQLNITAASRSRLWLTLVLGLVVLGCDADRATFANSEMLSATTDAGVGGAPAGDPSAPATSSAPSSSASAPLPGASGSTSSVVTGPTGMEDPAASASSGMPTADPSVVGSVPVAPSNVMVDSMAPATQPYCGDGILDPNEVCDEGTASSNREPDACRADCVLAACGDGVIDTGESCDEATSNDDTAANGCRTDCQQAHCGDGVLDAGEACDDGNQNSDSDPERCSTQCKLAGCGDGLLGMGEACDEGAANDDQTPDACRTSCQGPTCGDGVTDSDEQCDKGQANSDTQADACRADCSAHRCGDGVKDGNEACDGGEDCTDDCSAIVCGDGKTEGDEACDEGPDNSDTGDCTSACKVKACGDAKVQPGEECDDGVLTSQYGGCGPGCQRAPFCGDGNVDQGREACDEGSDNTGGYGKCKADCQLDARCGDGTVQSASGEQCDGGDACNAQCKSVPAAQVVSFTAADSVVSPGGSQTTLAWEVRNAESVKIEPGVGEVDDDVVSVTVNQTTTFTLTAQSPGGNATATVTISVSATGEQDSVKVHFGEDVGETVTAMVAISSGIYVVDTDYSSGDSRVRQFKENGSAGWVREIASEGGDYARAIAATPNGELVVVGSTDGELDSDREPNDSNEGFIARYSSTNQQKWIHTFGTTEYETANGVATDSSGNAYVCGETSGDLKGASQGGQDAYVVKYNADGSAGWTMQFGTGESEYAAGIAVDGSGNIFVAGSTMGSLQSGVNNAGSYDAYVTKLDSSGKISWTRMLGTSTTEFAHAIAVDGSGNVFVAGKTEGKIGGSDQPDYDAFLVKYSESGDVLWKEQLGTGAFDGALGVDTDSAGSAYLVGLTNDRIDPDYASTAPVDAFVAKYAADRELEWVRQFGNTGSDEAAAVSVDPSSRVVIAGTTQGNLFGTLVGSSDGFIVRYK